MLRVSMLLLRFLKLGLFFAVYLCLQCVGDDSAAAAGLTALRQALLRGKGEPLDLLIQEKVSVIIQDCYFQTGGLCVFLGGTEGPAGGISWWIGECPDAPWSSVGFPRSGRL